MGVTSWEASKILEEGGEYQVPSSMSKQEFNRLKALGQQGLPTGKDNGIQALDMETNKQTDMSLVKLAHHDPLDMYSGTAPPLHKPRGISINLFE